MRFACGAPLPPLLAGPESVPDSRSAFSLPPAAHGPIVPAAAAVGDAHASSSDATAPAPAAGLRTLAAVSVASGARPALSETPLLARRSLYQRGLGAMDGGFEEEGGDAYLNVGYSGNSRYVKAAPFEQPQEHMLGDEGDPDRCGVRALGLRASRGAWGRLGMSGVGGCLRARQARREVRWQCVRKERRKGTLVGEVEEGWAVHLLTRQFLAKQAVPVQPPVAVRGGHVVGAGAQLLFVRVCRVRRPLTRLDKCKLVAWGLINPEGRTKWDMIILVLLVWTCFASPLIICFHLGVSGSTAAGLVQPRLRRAWPSALQSHCIGATAAEACSSTGRAGGGGGWRVADRGWRAQVLIPGRGRAGNHGRDVCARSWCAARWRVRR